MVRRSSHSGVIRAIAAAAAMLLIAGCGGDGNSGIPIAAPTSATTAAPAADPTTVATPSTTSATTTTQVRDASVDGGDCPTRAEQLEKINDATYLVAAEWVVFENGEPAGLHYSPFGTAWGVGPHLLATNGHVADVFESLANQGIQLSRAIAIQAGTGEIVELLRMVRHPDWNGEPFNSPDVALFTVKEEIGDFLPLATGDAADVRLGDEILIVGFPGEVNTSIRVVPGQNVPQATSLTGAITALRTFDDREAVTLENLDYLQHQAMTSGGTSGSSMVRCGTVVGIHNAGISRLVVVPGQEEGEFSVNRAKDAANNFGIYVKHLSDLVELFEGNTIVGLDLPIDADTTTTTTAAATTTTAVAAALPNSCTNSAWNYTVHYPDGYNVWPSPSQGLECRYFSPEVLEGLPLEQAGLAPLEVGVISEHGTFDDVVEFLKATVERVVSEELLMIDERGRTVSLAVVAPNTAGGTSVVLIWMTELWPGDPESPTLYAEAEVPSDNLDDLQAYGDIALAMFRAVEVTG